MPNIRHEIVIDAPGSTVAEAIATLEGLRKWWSTEVSGNPNPGGEIAFAFSGGKTVITMEVVSLEPHIEWLCVGGVPEWDGTRVRFGFETLDNGMTLVRFGHLDWQSEEGVFARCTYDWGHYLTSLKRLVETGVGEPHPPYLGRSLRQDTRRNV